MARTLIASDNFNRAALGADWEQLNPISGNVSIFDSTHLETVDDGQARWVGTGAFTNDQYSSLVVKSIPSGGQGGFLGVIARASADQDAARDFYIVRVSDDDVLTIDKMINGTLTNLQSVSATEFAVNDRIEIEVEGTTIRALKNGTTLLTSTGQTELTTGKPGVLTINTTTPVWQADDWEGGNITAAVAVEGRILMAPYGSV